ncbi:MAG: hypothetical protein R3B13_14800 [Polyangiaceae bacterium]
MRGFAAVSVVAFAWLASCATAEDEVGENHTGGTGGKVGIGGFATGGLPATGGKVGTGGTSGSGGTGGALDASSDATLDATTDAADADAGSATGFGACVTEAEIANQSPPFGAGFCANVFFCFGCPNDAVKPGDLVCSPKCICAPLPPLCTDGGTDAGDAGDASDAGGADSGGGDSATDAPSDAAQG